MSQPELIKLLEKHQVKPTANRLIVTRALLDAKRPLSLMELEEKIESIDKSGIFRSLALFKERHLVHAIEGEEGNRYEICLSTDQEHDEDTHVHFYCGKCHRTFCLEEVRIPPVALPEGYSQSTSNYLVKGTCPDCSGKEEA